MLAIPRMDVLLVRELLMSGQATTLNRIHYETGPLDSGQSNAQSSEPTGTEPFRQCWYSLPNYYK